VAQELVAYMEHITDLNRNRNQQIIEQAKKINELLLTLNITPVFLKGTRNLLDFILNSPPWFVGLQLLFVFKSCIDTILFSPIIYRQRTSRMVSP
jgi:hypothetical protein